MRKITLRLLPTLLLVISQALCAPAQGLRVMKGNCTPGIVTDGEPTRGLVQLQQSNLRIPDNNWDHNKTYRQLVILVGFSDTGFSQKDAARYYDRMFNEPGYNEGAGRSCVADYFREQSGGLFNLQFDIYGPYQTAGKAQPYNYPSSVTANYGENVMREATLQMVAQNPGLDYKQYDWNGDGKVDQVLYIYAGIGGNQGEGSYGHIWPNTWSFNAVTTPDGTTIQSYSCSAELWTTGTSCGIGTICHEFSHCLGLPDIYPTSGTSGYFSVADEWDLMDGGNLTNWGWCPPNYTPLEKMLMGWLTPVELTGPTTIDGLKAAAEGGETYLVRHAGNEYLLLENRQWTGWDTGLPGRGLVIYHVDYDKTIWANNLVNTTKGRFRFDLVHADNLDYEQWDNIQPRNDDQYADVAQMMHNKHLSTSAYPWQTNNAMTDSSVPAAVMYNENAQGSRLLSKAITNIQMSDDGLVSFDFMGGSPAGISTPRQSTTGDSTVVCNIMGQRVMTPQKGLFIKNGKKYIKHF